jgi:acetyl esterase/lipase
MLSEMIKVNRTRNLQEIMKTVGCKTALRQMAFVLAMLFGVNGIAQVSTPAQDKPKAAPATSTKSAGVDDDLRDVLDPLAKPKAKPFSEDWTTPSLKGSSMDPVDPIMGNDDSSDPAYTFAIVRVEWRPGDPIDLFIMKPSGVAKPPVILYLYGYQFSNDRYRDADFRKFVTKNGFAAVGFVSALSPERFHAPRGMKEWFVSNLKEALSTSAHDVQMILNYLAQTGEFDMERVGMFGEGSGGSVAILAAAVDPRIKTLDLVNPWGDWPDWIAKSTLIPEKERPAYLKPEFLAGVAELDPVKWLPELKTQKIRLREVKSVTVTPPEARQKIEAAVPPKTEVVHYDDTKAFLAAISDGTAFDWIKEKMQTGKSQDYRASGQAQAKSSTVRGKE